MKIKGLYCLVLGALLCLTISGCSHHFKKSGKYGASTQGVGEGIGFAGSEQNLLAKRKIYFDFDRYDLAEQDFEVIQAHASYIKHHTHAHVRVEGHADEQGSREYNIALGEKRARAVTNALIAQGASSQQISVVSYGKEKPEVKGRDEEAYRLNRRAVIVYEDS